MHIIFLQLIRIIYIGNNLHAEGAEKISNALKANATLTELNLRCKTFSFLSRKGETGERSYYSGNDLGSIGSRLISEALKVNSTLTAIYLGCMKDCIYLQDVREGCKRCNKQTTKLETMVFVS